MLQVRPSTQETSLALLSLVMMYMVIRPLVVEVHSVRRHDLGSLVPSVPCIRCRPAPCVLPSRASILLGHHSSLVLPYKLLLSIG